jgi:hypothetical protein
MSEKTPTGKEASAPPPPPTFGTEEIVTMVEPTPEPSRPALPAHYVRRYQRRHELGESSSDDPSDEEAGFHLGAFLRKWAKLGRRRARYLYWWLVTHPRLITHPSRADWTLNQHLQAGHSFDEVVAELELDSMDAIISMELSPPLTPSLWLELVTRFDLTYPDLLSQWELMNIVQYRKAGITPSVLREMGVTADTLLDENRFDARTMNVFPFDGWKELGLRSRHLTRLGSDALAVFPAAKWRSIGVTLDTIHELGVTEQQLAGMYGVSVDSLLCSLAAPGEYVLMDAGHTHELVLDQLGNGCTEPGGHDGHVHEVIDGVVRGKHKHRLVRYVGR